MRVTLKKIAKLAGVSTTTASDALNNKAGVAEATREKVRAIAAQYGYVPDDVARSLVKSKTRTLGVMIVDIWAPIYAGVARGIEDVARKHEYSVFICNSDVSEEKERRYARLLLAKRVDGIAIVSSSAQGMASYFEQLRDSGKNFVVINRNISDLSIKSIFYDYKGGMYDVVSRAIRYGHRRIGYVGLINAGQSVVEQWKGFERALGDYGVLKDDTLIYMEDYAREKYYKTVGYKAAAHLLDLPEPPTVIVAVNDYIAQAILQVARDRGIRVPQDLSLIGFGDYELASLEKPALTSVRLPIYEAGVIAGEYLVGAKETMEFPVRLPCTVVERETLTLCHGVTNSF